MGLPERIYVKTEIDGEVEYLNAGYLPGDISEREESIDAGVYVLEEIRQGSECG